AKTICGQKSSDFLLIFVFVNIRNEHILVVKDFKSKIR
ncbi:MAG: hypothetical protein ACI884_001949, partial [Ulvibacter sp.]